MFSPTVIIGNSARCWNTMLTGRRFGGDATIDFPRIRMSPESGAAKPAIMRSRVVLPQPDGPRMEKNEPAGTENDTPSTARRPPNSFVTLTTSRAGAEDMNGRAGADIAPAPVATDG